jgi:hypothetical protein
MEIPEFNKDEIPQEVIDKVGEDFEIVPLIPENYTPAVDKGRDDYLNRKVLKQLDEMQALNNVYKKNLSKQETWKEIKKISRYFKSPLYTIKSLDREETGEYNTEQEQS